MEYLIKREDGNWFSLGPDNYESTLTPSSIAWERINGQGDFRIKCAEGEVSFSYEDPGILVSFESISFTEERCNKILDEVLRNIKSKTGEEGYVVPL
ncbi:hypothetical protein [Aliiglaciecola sp. M165]|uniref:hypothetical protein n=1 Tax=Aliiglaciecola sp. M165 TaxID=2593649 RepID=UPI00118027C0|nr:hypothetical protein [Aliiglaciecola sp. M165]TRY28748.1 hypothetical protein FM019_20490 [Aliiglaciecola sp. M165]